MSTIQINDGRDDLPVFIHSELDDYGLSAVEFRVYARLARRCYRGPGFESIPSMARDFEVSTRTVRRAVRLLVECRLVSETQRPGKTTLYTLTPRQHWLHKSLLKQTRQRVHNKDGEEVATPVSSVRGDTTDRGGGTPRTGVPLTPQIDEGNPLKVIPKGNPDTLSRACDEFAHVFGFPPHPHGQSEIAAEPVDDMGVWREVLKQARANLTPAKNVGTILKMYREQVERKGANAKRTEARAKREAARASPDDWKPRALTVEDVMLCEGVTRERAVEILAEA